jgi:tetratricopeptide (TPR) repeat protein
MRVKGQKLVCNLLTIALGLAAADTAFAATDGARRANAMAELLADRGQFARAAGQLSAVDCSGDAACRTLIDFGYGWLYESWSAADPANERALLVRARDHYRRASSLSPANAQILTNLALVSRRIGDLDTAIASIREAIRLNPDASYHGYLLLADAMAAAGDIDGAIGAYRSAIEQEPANKAAHQRLLEAYRKAGAYQELFRHSLAIRRSLPELAATGLSYSMQLGLSADPAMSDRALARWTAIRSDLGVLGPADLDALPEPSAWESRGFTELRDVVLRTDAPPRIVEIAWWRDTAVRQDAMARLLRMKGSLLRADPEHKARTSDERRDRMLLAIRYFKAAVDFAPPFEAYLGAELAGASNIRLDAASDLVALHNSIKAGSDLQSLSGLSRNELEQMTEILFSGKAGAYASGQLAAIQRYHTVLGLIYYATGQLTSDRADNATFQLEHAIGMAERIARQDATNYRPLPELQGLLADVYRQQGRESDSGRLLLDAAMGYLETDNLVAAETALDEAQSQGVDSSRVEALSTVLAGRIAIDTDGTRLVEATPGSPNVTLNRSIAWVADPASLDLPSRFVEGQRFKILADLGTLLTESGDTETARQLNAKALDAYAEQRILLSPTDLRRLQNVDKSITEKAGSAPQGRTNLTRGSEPRAND